MFAQAQRLDRLTFTDTYTHGVRIHMPSFFLVYKDAPTHKVAAVVGKKVARSAVVRNTLKRRIYAAIYKEMLGRGHIIVVAKPALRVSSFTQLQADIDIAIKRAFGRGTYSR